MGFICVVVKKAILNVIVMKMTKISTSTVVVNLLDCAKKKSRETCLAFSNVTRESKRLTCPSFFSVLGLIRCYCYHSGSLRFCCSYSGFCSGSMIVVASFRSQS